MKLPLSVLDLSPVGAGVAPSQAIRDSIALCKVAEELGFTRYWFAEHHNMASIATSAPEVLIAAAATATTRIKLGAGGIMVPDHAPLHVVEVFRTRDEPSQQHPAPYAMLAVTAVCAETDEAAERLAAPLRVAIVKNRTGRRAPIVPIEEALAYKFTPEEQASADEFFTGAVIGGPAKVAAGIQELARDTGADEIMVSALLPSLDDRTKSLTLIARALA